MRVIGAIMKTIFLAAALCAASPLWGACAGQAYAFGKYFSVVFPAGWTMADEGLGLSQEEKRVFGAEFFGPAGAAGPAARISAHYYAPGNLLHSGADQFINLHSRPASGRNPDGKRYSKVTRGRVAGYSAMLFERTIFEYLPHDAVNPVRFPIRDRFSVIPAGRGFFVLKYSAPAELYSDNLKSYEEAISSFKVTLR